MKPPVYSTCIKIFTLSFTYNDIITITYVAIYRINNHILADVRQRHVSCKIIK